MRLPTLFATVLALIVLSAGGLAVFLATLDVGRYKPDIIALIEHQTGRSVAIDGDIDLSIGLSPALVVEGVHLGNADWAKDPDMVSVGRLEAQIAVLPLLTGDLRVVRLVLADASVWLETDANGRGNWALVPVDSRETAPQTTAVGASTGQATGPEQTRPSPAPSSSPQKEAPPTGAKQTADAETGTGAFHGRLDIKDVRLKNATLMVRDGVRNRTLTLELDHAVLTGSDMDSPLQVDLAGRYNGLPFSAEGTLGSLTALSAPPSQPHPSDGHSGAPSGAPSSAPSGTESKAATTPPSGTGSSSSAPASDPKTASDSSATGPAPWPLDVTARVAGTTLMVNGTIANAIEGRGLDLTVTARGSQIADLAVLGPVLERKISLPTVGAYDLTVHLTGDTTALRAQSLDASLGTLPLLKANITGRIGDLTAMRGIALRITAEGGEVADLLRLPVLVQALDATPERLHSLPTLGPFRVSATVTGDPSALVVRDIDAGMGPLDGLRLTARGAITDVLAGSGLDLSVALNAPNPADLTRLGLPVSVPIQAQTQVSDITGGYRLADLQASMGRSRLTGTLETRFDGSRPQLTGQIKAPVLDFPDLTTGTSVPSSDAPASPTPTGAPPLPMVAHPATRAMPATTTTLIPDTPLPLDALRTVDASLGVQAVSVVLPNGLPLSDIALHMALANGTLTLTPLRIGLAGGTVTGTATLTSGDDGTAHVALDLSGTNIDMGTLAQALNHQDVIQGGPTSLRLVLTGHGTTLHQIAGTVNGQVLVHTVNATLNNTAVDWAGGDVSTQLMSAINPFGKQEATTPLRCLVVNLTAKNGVLTGDHGLAMETNRMVVTGGGGFDLGTERMSVKIAPAAREGIGLERGLGRIVELFAVTGPFHAPALILDAREAVRTGLRTAASAAGAVATGGLSLVGEDLAAKLLGGQGAEMEPCRVALGEKQPGQGDQDDTKDSGSAQDSVSETVDSVRDRANDAVDSLTKDVPEALGGHLRRLLNR